MPNINIATRALAVFAALGLAGAFTTVHAQAAVDSTGTRAVPTYEAVGLYWSNPGANTATGCQVKYRVAGSASWSRGLDMYFDASNNECRGSIVNLAPGTSYEVAFNLPGVSTSPKGLAFTTWSNTFPVAQTIKVPSGSQTLNVTAGGSASGYVVYDGTGSTLDAQNNAATNIDITASYVIVRGFTLKGAQQHGILIDKDQHDVIIEDNDISGWGRTRDGTWGTDMDSGIRAICVNEELTRVTVQRNRIHDPRYAANSWAVAHPAGPQGLTFSYCGGNNVYRWNEVYSARNHYNDGLGGEDNFSTNGWPNKDSDVYGNRVEMTWDDGIEAEGGDENVRIWGNYINNTGTGIASTIDSVGPMYIFRNVWNRNQFIEGAACDADQKQPMFKSGSSTDFGNGRRYLFHNTMLQAQQSGCTNGLGGGAGVGGTGDTQLVHNTVSMNNIYHVWKANGAFYQVGSDNTFQNDLTNAASSPEVGGIVATPQYASGSGWQSESGGLYQLAAGSPGFDQGVRIDNFNDRFNGAAPDVGAAEAGDPAMKFGVAAATSTTSAGGTGTTGGTAGGGSTGGGSTGGGTTGGGTTGGGGTGGTGSTGGTGAPTGSAAISATMNSSAFTVSAGQSVTFTAALMGNSGAPTGSVKFQDGSSAIAGCTATTVAAGKATCTTASLASGTHAITGIYSGDATYSAGMAGPITQTVSGSGAGATATSSAGAVSNISTRLQVLTGGDVMIGGFTIGGAANKTVAIVATGPSLAAFGIANPLANPTLTLVRSSDQQVIASNDDWQTDANAAQLQASGFAPGNPLESGLVVSLPPGAYTAVVQGANGSTGVGVVAVYQIDNPDAPLVNLSTRGKVQTGDGVMIGGFVIQGTSSQAVVVSATGPSLAAYGVADPIANPTLTLVRSSDQSVVASNTGWQNAPNASAIQASGFAPSDPRESAILATLPPGAYTAIVQGANGGTGVGVVGVFTTH